MDGENLNQSTIFDVAIIGGGIVGSGVFRDLALHDRSAIIIDQNDFNSQTSAGSSKMLHGGVRYLENFDFLLVFEALREKNLWLKLTPHLVKESPFFLPVYKDSKWPLFLMRIGLFIYDLLSLFKNSPHKTYNKQQTLKLLPGLKQDNLTGCGMYYDSIVDDHKLGLECIWDALLNPKCHALNYHKVISIKQIEKGYELTLSDIFTQKTKIIKAKNIVVAAGPFTDQLMQSLKKSWNPIILPSKGSHIWLKHDALELEKPMVLQTRDNRIIFVIPQRNAILVGTTEIPLAAEDNFHNLKPTKEEIEYLLGEVNTYFPKANINQNHILASFAAVRPLVKDGHKSAKVSRKHQIYHPQKNFYVLAGGKYTTFRKMAEDLNKKLFHDQGWKYNKKLSRQKLKHISLVADPNTTEINENLLQRICKEEFVKTKEDLIQRRLSLPSVEFLIDPDQKKSIEDFILEPVRKTE